MGIATGVIWFNDETTEGRGVDHLGYELQAAIEADPAADEHDTPFGRWHVADKALLAVLLDVKTDGRNFNGCIECYFGSANA